MITEKEINAAYANLRKAQERLEDCKAGDHPENAWMYEREVIFARIDVERINTLLQFELVTLYEFLGGVTRVK